MRTTSMCPRSGKTRARRIAEAVAITRTSDGETTSRRSRPVDQEARSRTSSRTPSRAPRARGRPGSLPIREDRAPALPRALRRRRGEGLVRATARSVDMARDGLPAGTGFAGRSETGASDAAAASASRLTRADGPAVAQDLRIPRQLVEQRSVALLETALPQRVPEHEPVSFPARAASRRNLRPP